MDLKIKYICFGILQWTFGSTCMYSIGQLLRHTLEDSLFDILLTSAQLVQRTLEDSWFDVL